MSLLLRRKAILAKIAINNIEKVALPLGYTQVEYIKCTGTQYIDTGFCPTGNTRIKTTFLMIPQSITNPFFSNITKQGNSIFRFVDSGKNGLSFQHGKYTVGVSFSVLQVDASQFWQMDTQQESTDKSQICVTILNDKNSLLWNSNYLDKQDFTSTTPLLLFLHRNIVNEDQINDLYYGKDIQLFTFKIYENNELVRDFIPCYKTIDDETIVIGLYDLINDQFYSNGSSGDDFEKGADIL